MEDLLWFYYVSITAMLVMWWGWHYVAASDHQDTIFVSFPFQGCNPGIILKGFLNWVVLSDEQMSNWGHPFSLLNGPSKGLQLVGGVEHQPVNCNLIFITPQAPRNYFAPEKNDEEGGSWKPEAIHGKSTVYLALDGWLIFMGKFIYTKLIYVPESSQGLKFGPPKNHQKQTFLGGSR